MPIQILMPALSPTMTEGNLAKWLKKEGDIVKAGDVIAEIETDKATMEVEAVDEGKIGKILITAGTSGVKVNTPIAVLLEEGEDSSALSKVTTSPATNTNTAPAAAVAAPTPTAPMAPQAQKQNASSSHDGDRVFATPLARRIAEQKNIDLKSIKGSGPYGRIVRADVENTSASVKSIANAATNDPSKTVNAFGMEYTAIPNNNIRKVVARRLLESKQTVPHFYLTIECVLDKLLAARAEMNDSANGAYKLSVNDFVIKAVAMALKSYPAANVAWTDEAVLQFKHADISVAVATPNGLITPIIKSAEEKSLSAISSEMKDLASRAKAGKLKPEEFQGGSFSISNLGMFGVKEFDAIINPPQACILAVGAGNEQPIVRNGKIEIATVMNCTLSVDHRAVDGAVGAEFLQHFKRYIENPVMMLA